MASLLRSVVAGPRLRHPEARLDLCYVTDNIIVTSGPSSAYPQRAYRNPTDAVVKWLDSKHGQEWAIWEFRAEGTGYPDSEVYNRVHHYPWPDHHPPPFHLIPNIVASMRNWLQEPGAKEKGRTVVIHCKAGKGRSGTIAASYLISQEGWKMEDALNRFTSRRMRPGFGAGVSIPSQLRWIGYVDRWAKSGKKYLERKVEILEVHVWGLREGVKVAVEGFVDEGKKIKPLYTFSNRDRLIVDGNLQTDGILASLIGSNNETSASPSNFLSASHPTDEPLIDTSHFNVPSSSDEKAGFEVGGNAVVFRSPKPVVLESSDVCIDFERRNRSAYGWTMVTSVAHVWFNAFFEGLNQAGEKADINNPPKDGVFNIQWDAMDGIKGTSRKGIRALDRLAIVWRALDESEGEKTEFVKEPEMGELVPEGKPADWRGGEADERAVSKDLGARTESPARTEVSKASSIKSFDPVPGKKEEQVDKEHENALEAVRTHGLDDEPETSADNAASKDVTVV